MDKQAREAKEMTKQLKGKEKWRNFWYYYRYHVIVGIFAFLIITYSLVECVNKPHYDLNISCYTSTMINDSNLTPITNELSKHIVDITKNDIAETDIIVNMASLEQTTEQTQAVLMKFSAELAAGESFGFLVDEEFYNMLTTNYSECVAGVIPVNNIPLFKDTLNLADGQNFYWITKALYETEKDKPEKIAAFENAMKVQNYLQGLAK